MNFIWQAKSGTILSPRGRSHVRASVEQSLTDLNFVDKDGSLYFDLYYVHWPVPLRFVEAYHELEALCKERKIRGLGLSNFNIQEYEELVKSGITIHPVASQFEVSPVMYRPDLVDYFQDKKMVVAASKSLNRTSAFENPLITNLAQRHSVSPAQIMIRWALQKNIIPICKTAKSHRMRGEPLHYTFLTEQI